jgi:hypothetical protein
MFKACSGRTLQFFAREYKSVASVFQKSVPLAYPRLILTQKETVQVFLIKRPAQQY